MNSDESLRQHVLNLLKMKGAHMAFDDAVADFPENLINTLPPNVPYTPWHLVEHLRITQWDILDYTRNSQYTSIEWPKDYWPARDTKADMAMWNQSIEQFRRDLKAMQELVANPDTDLFTPIPHGYGGHTVLREALILADHNAYHVGELAILRQVMNAWPTRHR
jgi:hypothetical protein